jgi:hypothetical protein
MVKFNTIVNLKKEVGMAEIKDDLRKIRMFSFIEGILLTIVAFFLADVGLTAFLLVVAWGGFFVITVKTGNILRSQKS